MKHVSCVVPVYNSESTLDELVARLMRTLDTCTSSYEIIMVNDCSKDASWSVISRLSQSYPNVIGINLVRNFGQHAATLCGVKHATKEFVVTLDDDLQHPPEYVPLLLEALDEGCDLAFGLPTEGGHHAWRQNTSKYLRLAIKLVGASGLERFSSFRAFPVNLRDGFPAYPMKDFSMDVLVWRASSSIRNVGFEHTARKVGKSNYSMQKLMRLAFAMLAGSAEPATLRALIGIASGLVAIFAYALCSMAAGVLGVQIQSGLLAGFFILVFALLCLVANSFIQLRLAGAKPFEVANCSSDIYHEKDLKTSIDGI